MLTLRWIFWRELFQPALSYDSLIRRPWMLATTWGRRLCCHTRGKYHASPRGVPVQDKDIWVRSWGQSWIGRERGTSNKYIFSRQQWFRIFFTSKTYLQRLWIRGINGKDVKLMNEKIFPGFNYWKFQLERVKLEWIESFVSGRSKTKDF